MERLYGVGVSGSSENGGEDMVLFQVQHVRGPRVWSADSNSLRNDR